MNSKVKNGLKCFFSILVTIIFLGTASSKIFGAEQMLADIAQYSNGKENLLYLAVCQYVLVVLFWIPRTVLLGWLLMICYMAGAMASVFSKGDSMAFQTFVEIIIWIAGLLRFPFFTEKLLKC